VTEELTATSPAANTAAFDLGKMLGQRQAFGTIAGRCSAADAECLRRMRDRKLYLERSPTWDEFCQRYLGLSCRHANRIIHWLEEFGPGYFELAQLTRIRPEEFRAIAPAVRDGSIHAHGEAIALIAENSERVAAAVADLRRASATPASTFADRLTAVERRANQVAAELRLLVKESPEGLDKFLLHSTIHGAALTMKQVELEIGL
jgi:hypothetical protein